MTGEVYWAKRALSYNNLQWATNADYLESLVREGKFNKNDVVLDVGCGTGIVTHRLAPIVKEVIGLDISQEMMDNANWDGNKYFIRGDARSMIFKDDVFDKLTARHVFHHIIEGSLKAISECYRVLKEGGLMVLSEGIPPDDDCYGEYKQIFLLKEERLVFSESGLRNLLDYAKFEVISEVYTPVRMSVRNWLQNSGVDKDKQEQIYNLHINGSKKFKKAYALEEKDGDCFITCRMAVIVGQK